MARKANKLVDENISIESLLAEVSQSPVMTPAQAEQFVSRTEQYRHFNSVHGDEQRILLQQLMVLHNKAAFNGSNTDDVLLPVLPRYKRAASQLFKRALVANAETCKYSAHLRAIKPTEAGLMLGYAICLNPENRCGVPEEDKYKCNPFTIYTAMLLKRATLAIEQGEKQRVKLQRKVDRQAATIAALQGE